MKIWDFHNLQLHLTYHYIKMCVLIRHTICENLVKKCVTIYTNAVHFGDIFSDIGHCFHLGLGLFSRCYKNSGSIGWFTER